MRQNTVEICSKYIIENGSVRVRMAEFLEEIKAIQQHGSTASPTSCGL